MKKVAPDCHFYDNESKGYMWAWSEWAKDKAVEAAVLAERKRVWDVLTSEMIARDTIDDIDNEYRYMRKLIFPNGEPTAEDSSADQTNPPAGERREM